MHHARQLHEYCVDILAECVVGTEKTVIRVLARRSGMVVSGTQMYISLQSTAFPPHDQGHLAVRFEPDHAIDDVGPGFLEAVGQMNVRRLVESRP